MKNSITRRFMARYVSARPLFLSFLRAKEAALYQAHLPLTRPVLDVGCGDGFFAAVTFGARAIDTGLDMKESRMGQAGDSHAYLSLLEYDGVTMPVKNRTYKTVVVNSVLEHVENLPQVIGQMFRVLRPGGICFATVMAAPWERNLLGARIFGDAYRKWMRKKQVHVNLLTVTEWKKAFVRQGFRVRTVTPYISPRAAMMLDFLHYVSLPSMISYLLVKRWVVAPMLTGMYPLGWLSGIADEAVDEEEASALFFVLERP